MSDVTFILKQVDSGDPLAPEAVGRRAGCEKGLFFHTGLLAILAISRGKLARLIGQIGGPGVGGRWQRWHALVAGGKWWQVSGAVALAGALQ